MLHLYFEALDKLVERKLFMRYPGTKFNCCWKREWLNDSLGRKLIREIDHVDVPDDMDAVTACLLKNMLPESLSTGTKTLMMCRYYRFMNRMTMLGKNCYRYLIEIADEKEVYMGCSNYVFFTDDDLQGRKVHFVNTKDYVSTAEAFAEHVYQIVDSGILGFTILETCK